MGRKFRVSGFAFRVDVPGEDGRLRPPCLARVDARWFYLEIRNPKLETT